MNKMTTLTIGDKTWQVCDPEAARIDDTKVGDTAWSSQKLVEMLCPERTARGESVTLRPMPGTCLQVTADIAMTQSGSGEPSCQNVRPITGHTAATVTVDGEKTAQYTADFGQDIYGGALDVTTGILTVTHVLTTFTGEETGWRQSGSAIINYDYFNDAVVFDSNSLEAVCSHTATSASGKLNEQILRKGWKKGYMYVGLLKEYWGLPDTTVDSWVAYLRAQTAAGTPLQVVYRLEIPLTVQLTPVQIPAQTGENRISCDTGACAVTYRADPRVLLEKINID